MPTRILTLVVAFIAGACAGTAIHGAATEGRAPVPAAPAATVVHATAAEHRQVGGGKADIYLYARGANAFVGRLEMAGGGSVGTHRDPTEEYIHVLQGGGRITIDGQTHEIRPGTTVFMPAGAEVRFENGPERLVALQVFAGPAPAAKYDAWTRVQ